MLRIPHNMVRFFGTLSAIVTDMNLFDPLEDHTTREFEFASASHLAIDQEMLDWFIRVYQIHYGYHQHLSSGKDDGRDKPIIVTLPMINALSLSALLTMINVLDFYDASLLLNMLMTKTGEMLRSYTPTHIKPFPVASYSESVLKEEVWRRKTIHVELSETIKNLDLVDRLTERLWPTLGPLVACGAFHSMVVTSEGLFGMGSNIHGQLGLDEQVEEYANPTRIDLAHVLSVVCRSSHSMMLTRDGLFVCGKNDDGQLGLGDREKRVRPTRVPLENVLSVACSEYHTLILTSEGLFGCGDNRGNQLGIEGVAEVLSPTRLPFENVLSMACGPDHTMVLTRDGLYACGKNDEGQLGLGHHSDQVTPVRVPIENVLTVSCGNTYTMIRTRDGLFACGRGWFGQLGLGDNRSHSKLMRVPLENVLAVVCGDAHTMILTCEGLFGYGTIGVGRDQPAPMRVDIDNVLAVACGHTHTMILTTDGLFAMGSNVGAQLGLGHHINRAAPTKVPLRIGYEQSQREGEEDRATKRRRLGGVLLCTCCNEVGSFLDPIQRRYLFCSERCYRDFFPCAK